MSVYKVCILNGTFSLVSFNLSLFAYETEYRCQNMNLIYDEDDFTKQDVNMINGWFIFS